MTNAGQEINVSDAFSRQSAVFDEIDEQNGLLLWIRKRVRQEVLAHITPSASMLELNCGTGLDAVFFAQQGCKVLATDNAAGMLQVLHNKIEALNLQSNLSYKRCSFNSLEKLGTATRFDYVFSNFGGLNCTDRLDKVLGDINDLLKPGGYFTLVIMPPVCPWEIGMLFKGKFRTAFRRFAKSGTNSHLEGVYFQSYYYKPSYIVKRMPGYKIHSLKGLSIVVPPPFIEHFCERHPHLFSMLERVENRIWDKAPFNKWCDHFILTMQKPYEEL